LFQHLPVNLFKQKSSLGRRYRNPVKLDQKYALLNLINIKVSLELIANDEQGEYQKI